MKVYTCIHCNPVVHLPRVNSSFYGSQFDHRSFLCSRCMTRLYLCPTTRILLCFDVAIISQVLSFPLLPPLYFDSSILNAFIR